MDKSNKIENLANKYVERHIRDRHLSDDTIKEIKIAYIMIIKDFIAIVDKSTSMNEDDIIYVVNNISSILYEPVEISNTDKKILEIGIALGLGYDGGSKDMINRKRLIGNTYQIYRSILHQLAIDENWNNVYSDITLPSGDMGTIKVERIDDEKKDEDV